MNKVTAVVHENLKSGFFFILQFYEITSIVTSTSIHYYADEVEFSWNSFF